VVDATEVVDVSLIRQRESVCRGIIIMTTVLRELAYMSFFLSLQICIAIDMEAGLCMEYSIVKQPCLSEPSGGAPRMTMT
jgi:hypothetical protein